MKKDIVWIDYARFIGISLVIFGHSLQRIPDWNDIPFIRMLYDYIYLFHMPLFFIISGYLYKQKKSNMLLGGGKIWRTLIVPYILYQLIYFPFVILHYIKSVFFDSHLLVKLMAGLVTGDGYETPFSIPVCLPCWFIICIVQIRLIFLVIPINRVSSFSICLMSVLILAWMKIFNWDFYFCIDSTLMAIPYFLIGYYMRTLNIIEKVKSVKWLVMVTAITGMLVYYILDNNGAAQMNGPSYGKDIFINYIAGISGCLMVFAVSRCMELCLCYRDYVRIISRNTLFLIFFHWLLMGIMTQFTKRIMRFYDIKTFSAITTAFLLTVVILWVSKITIDYISNKSPLLLGKAR